MLPLRLVAQQILSVVNAATVVERETRLTDVKVNGPGFEEARKRGRGLGRHHGARHRQGPALPGQERPGRAGGQGGFDTGKLFAAGGVFYDDALDYPLPLAGINYFSFDFKGTGKQVNVFFAGALLIANVAEPRLFGSRFDAGVERLRHRRALSPTPSTATAGR